MDIQKEIRKILDFEKENYGIDWLAFYNADDTSNENIRKRFANLNIDINIDDFRENPQMLLSQVENRGRRGAEKQEGEPVVNLIFYNDKIKNILKIDQLQNLSGDEIKKEIISITQKLQRIQSDWDATMIAKSLTVTGILSIGGIWGKAAATALRNGSSILASCMEGIVALESTATVVAMIVLIVVAVLIPFLLLMDKKAEMLMVVLNRTTYNLDMESYFKHGKMVQYPEDDIIEGDKVKKVAILAGEKIGNDYEICYAGMIFVSKRDKALYGVEGAIKFLFDKKSETFPNGVYLGFSVPLAQGKNAGYISSDSFKSPEDFFKSKYNEFELKTQKEDSSKLLQCRIDRGSGGEPAMIAVIQDLKKS